MDIKDILDNLSPQLKYSNLGALKGLIGEPFIGEEGRSPDGFKIFESYILSVRAMARVLLTYNNRGINTINKLVDNYAPASDNSEFNRNGYKNHHMMVLNLDSLDTEFDIEENLFEIIQTIIKHEGRPDAHNPANEVAIQKAIETAYIDDEETVRRILEPYKIKISSLPLEETKEEVATEEEVATKEEVADKEKQQTVMATKINPIDANEFAFVSENGINPVGTKVKPPLNIYYTHNYVANKIMTDFVDNVDADAESINNNQVSGEIIAITRAIKEKLYPKMEDDDIKIITEQDMSKISNVELDPAITNFFAGMMIEKTGDGFTAFKNGNETMDKTNPHISYTVTEEDDIIDDDETMYTAVGVMNPLRKEVIDRLNLFAFNYQGKQYIRRPTVEESIESNNTPLVNIENEFESM